MNKYEVNYTTKIPMSIVVEANNSTEAIRLADECINEGMEEKEHIDRFINSSCDGYSVTSVNTVSDPVNGPGKLSCIVCVDANNGIGFNGELLIHNGKDLSLFKNNTMGKIVVMGGETYRSLPTYGSNDPLPGRKLYVLSMNEKTRDNVIVFNHIKSLRSTINGNLSIGNDVVICGGQTLYDEFMNEYDKILMTRSNKSYKHDRKFPIIDENVYEAKESKILDIVYDSQTYKAEVLTITEYEKKG